MLVIAIKTSNPIALNSGAATGGLWSGLGGGAGPGLIEQDGFFGVGVSYIKKSSELLFVS